MRLCGFLVGGRGWGVRAEGGVSASASHGVGWPYFCPSPPLLGTRPWVRRCASPRVSVVTGMEVCNRCSLQSLPELPPSPNWLSTSPRNTFLVPGRCWAPSLPPEQHRQCSCPPKIRDSSGGQDARLTSHFITMVRINGACDFTQRELPIAWGG